MKIDPRALWGLCWPLAGQGGDGQNQAAVEIAAGSGRLSYLREQHASNLRSLVKALQKDRMAIFGRSRMGPTFCDYMLGTVQKREALAGHREWTNEYEMAR